MVEIRKAKNGRAQNDRERNRGKMQSKSKSVRNPLRDVSNTTNDSVVLKKMNKQQHDDSLDNLLLVQSDLTRRIDEVVAEAFKLSPTSKEAKREIESLSGFLSNTIQSLKPWLPRFRKLVSNVGGGNAEYEGDFDCEEGEKLESLISPSPLVSWRGGCNVERGGGRQLFLLTPLPISKMLSLKRQELAKSVFERVGSVEFPSLLMVSEDVEKESRREGVLSEANTASGCGVVSSPAVFSKGDKSLVVMTPCLKMSPPKSCVLIEPISESSHKGSEKMRKSTPYPVGLRSSFSDSSDSDDSEDLSVKYPELWGIQHGYKFRIEKKMDESPQWSFSPPKTCVLLNPSDEKSDNVAATNHDLAVCAPASKENDVGHSFQRVKSSRKPFVESTPMCKEPESTLRTGKPAGETTLKRELWTKFEAASSYGFRANAPAFQRTAKKGFLDMLDEACCDGESAVVADGFR